MNFDGIIDRKNTNCLKYDFALQRKKPEGLLSFWIADMDFQTAPEIVETIQKRTAHGIFGYSEAKDSYFDALKGWMADRHGWEIERKWLVKTPGVVFALAMAVQAYTNAGDGVIIQQPVYYPFQEVIADNNRKVIDNTLIQDESGRYHMNLDEFERQIIENKVKLFLLCSPHNPVGRVWTKEELERLGNICTHHDVIIVSDEIHADFVFSGRHQVLANISEELKMRTITCTSPSKTFNLAGLQVSNILIPNPDLRKKFKARIAASGYSQLNLLGLVACEAAYRDGMEWYQELMEYLKGNLEYIQAYLEEHLPKIHMTPPEGTYLVWLDFKNLKLTEEELEHLIVQKAGLWLDSGAMFGKTGEGFERINAACPRSILEKALKQLESAVNSLE